MQLMLCPRTQQANFAAYLHTIPFIMLNVNIAKRLLAKRFSFYCGWMGANSSKT